MSLSRQVDPEEIIQHFQDLRTPSTSPSSLGGGRGEHLTPFSTPYASQRDIPKYQIPQDGAPGDTVYEMIKDELDLDGRPNLNLASFVDTYLEGNAQRLMVENLSKNLADNDEYPAMLAISNRCVSILAHLWGVRKGERAVGAPTVGSSEAIHLGGLAMKRRWQERRRAQGRDTARPNIVMGANAQVALLKFARYFEVEERVLPVSAKSRYCLDPDLVRENIDENTIGVFVILGSTYTGHYEPVEEISRILDQFQEKTGVDIPIHVDAASGGFVAPFTHAGAGGRKWNFELPRVVSINSSGHKYGLVTAGVGWIIWRDQSYLSRDLIFELHYLGGTEESFTLNFSRPGSQVIVQYYNLIHLGFSGYREIMENCLANARILSQSLEATGWYTCISEIHRPLAPPSPAAGAGPGPRGRRRRVKGAVTGQPAAPDGEGTTGTTTTTTTETSAGYVAGLPVVSFRLTDEFRREYPHVRQETISLLLRARQWIVPNYALPPGEDGTEILRVVVRVSMSFDLLDRLVTDIVQVTETLMERDEVDLSVLPAQHVGPRPRVKKREGERLKDVGREAGKKRMTGGIHRSVC
ncbi:glutamate decarboxylase [Thermothelomyces thermophilus ATCC 42464]|uniref:Glutamate decarboxylase n=1 Tax=Thermothelomyces thermophilus (strain ATCC 42464 / BCRC 31852 / DSM 1799) TaxID=573729 RepID=G2Q703_THET4|nr:glutamate decarboxylase [Thermothelomyces thermophilus ATCC 42464]AEO54783.1 glutamate decarboxylase [Thermothelomyces thermophilus ATCC 42464]